MKNYNFPRLIAAVMFTLATVMQTLALAAPDQPLTPAMIERLRRLGPDVRVESNEILRDGIITYTMRVTVCQQIDSNCQSRSYRTTRTVIPRDGGTMAIETVDQMPLAQGSRTSPQKIPAPERLNFSVSTVSGLEMLPHLNMEIHPNSQAYSELVAFAPEIATGILNAVQDMQASAAVAARLQEGYQRSLDGFQTANDHLVQAAQKQQQMGEQASNYFRVLAAASMTAPTVVANPTKEYQEYSKAAQDPFSFREYELVGAAGAQVLASAKEAIRNRQPRKALATAEKLFHQKDEALRREASKNLSVGFYEGVLRSQVFGAGAASALDAAHFKTPLHSPAGEIVRQLANQAQITWIDSRGMSAMDDSQASAYVAALASLRTADDHFVRGKASEGLYFAEATKSLLDFSTGFYNGSVEGVSEAAKALPAVAKALGTFGLLAATNPEAAAGQLGHFVVSLPGVVEAVATHYWALGEKVVGGTAKQKGEALGQLGSEVLIALITDGAGTAVKGLTATARASRLGQAAARFGAAAVTPVLDVTRQLGPARVKAMATIAITERPLAVEMLKATRALSDQGAGAAYLDVVLGTGKPVTAVIKSAKAITEAVNTGIIQSREHLLTAKGLQSALDKAPHPLSLRFMGGNGKVVVIGRSMEKNVLPVAKVLSQNGVKAEVFSLSEDAIREWDNWKAIYPHTEVPVEIQRAGVGFMENKNWIQSKIDQGYTIIDANNPMAAPPSLYYDMEHELIARAKEKLR